MKISDVLPVSIVLVSILFCPMVRAAPRIPDDVQIVAPDPSLPKELSALFGNWEGRSGDFEYFVIVAQIDKEKAILHILRHSRIYSASYIEWETIKAEVVKEGGRYELWYRTHWETSNEAYLYGEYLHVRSWTGILRLYRVR